MSDSVVKPEEDLACGRIGLLLWGTPLLVVGATGFAEIASATRGAVWALALLWAGVACLVNARRSRRLHCFITGPFFIGLAGASLLHGLGWVTLGSHGWLWIGGLLALGFPLLAVLPERAWGRYASRGRERCC